jgi:hypothetical protein
VTPASGRDSPFLPDFPGQFAREWPQKAGFAGESTLSGAIYALCIVIDPLMPLRSSDMATLGEPA